jgi:hypothetical protein
MKTLILPPKYSSETILVGKAARAAGWEVIRLTSWQVPDELRGKDIVIYGEPLFAARLEDVLGIQFPNPPDDWLLRLPPDMLRREVRAMTLFEARKLTERWFVKPANYKIFAAGVFGSGAELPNEEQAPGEDMCLVAEVVQWESEFRFFMRDGKVTTGSVYFRNGQTAEKDGEWLSESEEYREALDLAERAYAATKDHLPAGVVIDTGYITGKGWAVIEANPAWGSGLYGSDPSRVLDVIG